MIKLKDILKEVTQCSGHGRMAPGELVWSHAPSLDIHKKWEAWRIESMNKINLLGWEKIGDLVTDDEIDLERDKKGLFMAGTPANEPIYGLEIIQNENGGYIYQMDVFVHNKKRLFEK